LLTELLNVCRTEGTIVAVQDLAEAGAPPGKLVHMALVLPMMLDWLDCRHREEAQAREAHESPGPRIGRIQSSSRGRFQAHRRPEAGSSVFHGNVASFDQYEVDTSERALPAHWIPRSLDDIVHQAMKYDKLAVLQLLRNLGTAEAEVEAIEAYIDCSQSMQNQIAAAQIKRLTARLQTSAAPPGTPQRDARSPPTPQRKVIPLSQRTGGQRLGGSSDKVASEPAATQPIISSHLEDEVTKPEVAPEFAAAPTGIAGASGSCSNDL